MEDKRELDEKKELEKENAPTEPDEDWPHQTIQDLEDFIESQGIYIRQ